MVNDPEANFQFSPRNLDVNISPNDIANQQIRKSFLPLVSQSLNADLTDSPKALSKRFNNASFVSQSSIGRRNGRMTKSIDLSHLNRLAKREGPYVLHREGKIREIANLTNLDENFLENEILNSLSKANRKESTLYNNQAMSRGGFRYYVGKGPNIKQLE